MMIFYLVVIFSLRSVNSLEAEESYPCVLQFDAKVKCILELVGSDEAKLIENKTKTIFHTVCAPEYPLDCLAEFQAAKECYAGTKDQLDDPGNLKKAKDSAFAAAEACLGNKSSNNFLRGLEDIFMPSPIKIISSRLGNDLWGDGHMRGPFANGPLASAILKGIRATTTAPPPPLEKELESAAGSNATKDKQRQAFGRPECAPKASQFMCTFKEMNKLANTDPDFKNGTTSLRKRLDLCKKVIEQRCSPSSPEESRCVADAHLPLMLAFVDMTLDCMRGKGYTVPPFLPTKIPPIFPLPKISPPPHTSP